MDEGLEYDDKYRMVEDEFLTVAKQFTVHIHAAEYERQKKIVKSRKADTIDTISRPVTGRMPDHTRRRVEAASHAKAQKAALEDLLPKQDDGSDDSDDAEGLPYFGTTLHGLMDSPRKKAASLTSLGKIAAATRAAAGFKQSGMHSRPTSKGSHVSPMAKIAVRAVQGGSPKDDELTESDDDDLGKPISASTIKFIFSSGAKSSTSTARILERKSAMSTLDSTTKPSTSISRTTKSFPPSKSSSSSKKGNSFSAVESKISDARDPFSEGFRPSAARLEKARRKKAKLEKEQQEKEKLDIIPTFL